MPILLALMLGVAVSMLFDDSVEEPELGFEPIPWCEG